MVKKRLILDLRIVNKYISFKYDIYQWMIKYDMHSAYHFIDIYLHIHNVWGSHGMMYVVMYVITSFLCFLLVIRQVHIFIPS